MAGHQRRIALPRRVVLCNFHMIELGRVAGLLDPDEFESSGEDRRSCETIQGCQALESQHRSLAPLPSVFPVLDGGVGDQKAGKKPGYGIEVVVVQNGAGHTCHDWMT